jgi:hypothetical protein
MRTSKKEETERRRRRREREKTQRNEPWQGGSECYETLKLIAFPRVRVAVLISRAVIGLLYEVRRKPRPFHYIPLGGGGGNSGEV